MGLICPLNSCALRPFIKSQVPGSHEVTFSAGQLLVWAHKQGHHSALSYLAKLYYVCTTHHCIAVHCATLHYIALH